ncbi:Lrp/AsnC family transcriptional regulator [Mangrovihabitans endophyticus]|uniref:AsnC family transcriptional regulator n=1 Tax=Mangrovihabitans endophyticus TaxID=1751298 RepID=A0A8J3FRX0_9ACTN|nr:AsnC family transcriptional regulator [Mangrovihabitans endophyticus]GGL19880.1 AsnC family transcriptional regulator [Mangrovihabitans endophyticus]
MTTRASSENITFDEWDRRILHALQLAPRAPFARMGAVLGVSEQTVARRYQRMRTRGVLRVLGRLDPDRLPDTTSWVLRIGCRPGTAAATARALARRDDTAWVAITAGGAELTCRVAVRDTGDGGEGLLHQLPRASHVLSLSAHQVLHRFVGRGEADWVAVGDELSAAQRAELAAASPQADPDRSVRVEPSDAPLLEALARDGRASFAALAAATGWSQRQVAGRVEALTAGGALWFDVDTAVASMGFRTMAYLWFTVAPAHLASVGARLADHRTIVWAAAVTGSGNIMAAALCRDAPSLYRYLTTDVAGIDEVRTLETVPVLTRVKQARFLVENGLLKDPAM